MDNKILVAVPYHKEKAYCVGHLFQLINDLTYKNKEVIMRWDLEKYGGKNNVKKQREYFRQIAIKGDFDYLYFLGADTIPPINILERFLAEKKDVIGGIYWGRHGADNSMTEGAVAWIHKLTPSKQLKEFTQDQALVEVDGMGMDCVMFSREAFKSHSFMEWEQNDDDYPYYDLLKASGFEIFVDTSIQCRHYSTSKDYSFMSKKYTLTEIA